MVAADVGVAGAVEREPEIRGGAEKKEDKCKEQSGDAAGGRGSRRYAKVGEQQMFRTAWAKVDIFAQATWLGAGPSQCVGRGLLSCGG